MNMACIGGTGGAILLKLSLAEGSRVLDMQVFRNISMLTAASAQVFFANLHPVKSLPWQDRVHILFWRCVTGQSYFLLFNFCLMLVPLTFQQIILQTFTFWAGVIAFCVFNERMTPLEIISLFTCFGCMVTITITGANNSSDGQASSEDAETTNYSTLQLMIGYPLCLALSLTAACNLTFNRALKGVNSGLIIFWHASFGLFLAVTGVIGEYFVRDRGSGEGFHLFNMSPKCYGLMIAAAIGDTMGVSFFTIAA